MSLAIELLLGVFLVTWLLKGVVNFLIGLIQIAAGIIGVAAVLIWTAVVAVVNLPLLLIPSKRRT
ncbi:MAG: hypothetical protein EBR40_00160 [Proteobacteria bacterium]|nr:hypothetical protein [Pseudomonadota bacterium]